jgi:hypothetical protein
MLIGNHFYPPAAIRNHGAAPFCTRRPKRVGPRLRIPRLSVHQLSDIIPEWHFTRIFHAFEAFICKERSRAQMTRCQENGIYKVPF